MQALSIINQAAILLNDSASNVRWPKTQLLTYLNDGQREVVIFRPDASVQNSVMMLTAGNTKQSIPADGIRLIDVIRNMGSGSTAGVPVMVIDRDILDTQIPTWHSDDASSSIKHYTFDPKDPETFYVYPQPAASVHLEIVYSVPPADCDVVGDNISISDIYTNALLDYIMYRAFSKDTEYANPNKAANYYQMFRQSLGLKAQIDMTTDPNAAVRADGKS